MAGDCSTIVGVCWVVFALYWLISALTAKRAAERQNLWAGLAHRLPLALAAFLMAYRHWPPLLDRVLTQRTNFALAMGAAICLCGLAVTLWARWTLASNWSSVVEFKQGHELVRSGPYQFARHPIYSGLLLMFIGTAAEFGRVHSWLAVPVVVIGFWIKLRQEEALLRRHFPQEYPAYCRRVKALVPFLL